MFSQPFKLQTSLNLFELCVSKQEHMGKELIKSEFQNYNSLEFVKRKRDTALEL